MLVLLAHAVLQHAATAPPDTAECPPGTVEHLTDAAERPPGTAERLTDAAERPPGTAEHLTDAAKCLQGLLQLVGSRY